MAEQNGDFDLDPTQVVDQEDTKDLENPRFLNPGSLPENLVDHTFGIGCPMPTRMCTRETAIALKHLKIPMFGKPLYYSPDGMEVGEARNSIVRDALRDGVEWLFFLDYDVAPPPHALVKLLSIKADIAAGVYHSKEVPSYPLIYVKGWKYAFEEYTHGDYVKADGIGMGCTLIKMDVFKKIDPPWFKTVPGYSLNSSAILPHMTEDIYFCAKARKAGYEIIVDTGIQAQHVNWHDGLIYQGIPSGGKIVPSWIYRKNGSYVIEQTADVDHPNAQWASTKKPKNSGLKIDLGCGGSVADGFIGVDLHVTGGNIINGDISDLEWFRKEHGLADEIRSSHSLEHMGHRHLQRILRDWVNTLKPGGKIEIRVPDLEFHMKKLVEVIDRGEDRSPEADYWLATIYGWQIGEGHEHKTGFTENRLRQLARSCGVKDVKISKQVNEGSPSGEIAENAELVLTGKRGK